MPRLIPILLLLVSAAGCGDSDGVCTLEARPSFLITVVDSTSGANLAPSATVVVQEGAFFDTLVAFPSSPGSVYSGVYERAGMYRVSISASGYLPWTQSNVRVEEGACHVTTQVFTARLVRAPVPTALKQ